MSADATIADVLSGSARWCVVEADSIGVLSTLGDGSVDHVICDPPYDAKTHVGAMTNANDNEINFAPLADARGLAGSLVRIAKRWAIAFCTVEQIADYRDGSGIAWVRAGIWDKVNPTPQMTGDRPGQAVEGIATMHRAGRKRWNRGGGAGIWRCSVEHGQKNHPTQKPLVGLMTNIVEDFTDPDDLVLDPFAGSGTTGVAALRLGRRAILIERDPKYAALCRERMEAESRGTTLQLARAGQASLFDFAKKVGT